MANWIFFFNHFNFFFLLHHGGVGIQSMSYMTEYPEEN